MQYKLINKTTGEETICTKVVIDGFDYYVSDDKILNNEPYISLETNYATDPKERYVLYYLGVGLNGKNPKKVIATNNSIIDILHVVNEVQELAENSISKMTSGTIIRMYQLKAYEKGYKNHAETHTLSDDEVVEFGQWVSHNDWVYLPSKGYWVNEEQEELDQKLTSKELLQLFKEQQIKTIYYE